MNAAACAETRETPQKPAPRLLRKAEVLSRTGLTMTTHAELVKRGLFPKPIRLTRRIFVWHEHEVDEWIFERIRVRDEGLERDDRIINADLTRRD